MAINSGTCFGSCEIVAPLGEGPSTRVMVNLCR
jgi:hypothetical protein